jgi:hypothetical protein
MDVYLPQDWQAEVRPPGSGDFEANAVAWLLDVLPDDFRRHQVLRWHPAALASMARHYALARVQGAREGYRTARVELGVSIPPHAVDGVFAAYKTQGFKLARVARGVELVERALRGETFAPKL